MKQTHTSAHHQDDDIDKLIYLASSAHLLEEKTRINLYLPKAIVKIMDSIAKNQSRSELVKNLVVEKAKKTQPAKTKLETKQDPYGIFKLTPAQRKDLENIDQEIKQMWQEVMDKLEKDLES